MKTKISEIMETLKKDMKRLVTGAAVGIFALGLSSFANSPENPLAEMVKGKQQEHIFTRVSGPANSTNPNDYEYIEESAEDCLGNPESTCTARWSQSTAPDEGDSPTGTFVAIQQTGVYTP